MKWTTIVAVVFFGFQGLIYAVSYKFIKSLASKRINKTQRYKKLIYSIFIGSLSGIISGSFNIISTYYNAIGRYYGLESFVVSNEVKYSVIITLIYYSIGCIVFGSIISLLIEYREWGSGVATTIKK